MQNSAPNRHPHSKMDVFRKTIKVMPLIGQKTRDLTQKYENYVRETKRRDSGHSSSNDDTSECQSNFTGVSQNTAEAHYYNAFLQNYQLLEKLGEGANGCVFKCRFKPNNRFYAAKKIRIQQQHITELKKNFISLKQLNHPSICRYKALYFDQNERFAFLVMQYLPFPSLAAYKIKQQRELKVIAKEIISAITYIHNRNLCHRDIKPENILYDEKTRKIKIIDFDIAKRTFSRGSRRDMLTIIGTHFYLAPEVYNGGGYDEKIDIWAFGVTVFKMVAGYTPFESEYHSETIMNILRGEVTFDDQIWKKYSPFARSFVSELLKNKKQRITLVQAAKHLWFHSSQRESSNLRLRKMRSQNISLCEDFHHEFHNKLRNAVSKEEGSSSVFQQNAVGYVKLSKKINLMDVKQYCLEDSDDEASFLTAVDESISQKNGAWVEQ